MKPTADNANLSFLEHLEELRARLIKAIIAFVLGVCVGWFLSPNVLDLLTEPVERAYHKTALARTTTAIQLELAADNSLKLKNPQVLDKLTDSFSIEVFKPGDKAPVHTFLGNATAPMIYLRPMDPFVIRMKAAIGVGLVLSIPFLLFQAWAFIAPGLLPNEKRLAGPLILAGSVLFPIGATFAYFLLEVTLGFLAEFAIGDTAMQNDAQAYISFALTMMMAFGAVFEFPLVVVLLTRVGIVSTDWLAKRRAHIFVFQLIVSAVVTPTGDPLTLMAMALPLQILFEIALLACRFLDRLSARDKDMAETN